MTSSLRCNILLQHHNIAMQKDWHAAWACCMGMPQYGCAFRAHMALVQHVRS